MAFTLFLAILFFIVILTSCSNDAGVNPIDLELQKNIIGTWQDNAKYTVTFSRNGAFIDSVYYFDQFVDTSIIVRKGKYNIDNSVSFRKMMLHSRCTKGVFRNNSTTLLNNFVGFV